MLTWAEPDQRIEATGDSDARRAQRANKAAKDVMAEYGRLEDATADQVLKRLNTLRDSLRARMGTEFLTDFKRYSLDSLLRDVDRLIFDTTKAIETDIRKPIEQADGLGDANGILPMQAAGVRVSAQVAMPGVDLSLVQATFGNMVDLLTPPMQQFGTQLKTSLRRVALAGEGRMTEIKRLKDHIEGAGFASAQYKAERMIRTELGRTFNESTYGKLVDLGKTFRFIRKCWRCTRDNRTRIGHVQAAVQYAKGKGIPINERFQLRVYDERKGQNPKLIGTAFLRFPIDPLVTPDGRIGAGATILCRCNSFVDFDMADFAAYTKQQVALALGGATNPPTELPPAAPVATPAPKPVKPRKPRLPKVPTAAALIGAPISKVAAPSVTVAKVGPNGLKVSGHLVMKMPKAADLAAINRALAVLDSVHGDGLLPAIPVAPVPNRGKFKNTGAFYMHNGRGRAISLGFRSKLLKATPRMTVFHETGHFLDDQAFGDGTGVYGSEGADPKGGVAVKAALSQLNDAMRKSKSYQTLVKWSRADTPAQGIGMGTSYQVGGYDGPDIKSGEGDVPNARDIHRDMIKYMMKSKETFARAYAQYVAVTSKDPDALKELRRSQAASDPSNGVAPGMLTENPVLTGKKHIPGTWAYPWQWSDADFEPIQKAFDQLFEAAGWRK